MRQVASRYGSQAQLQITHLGRGSCQRVCCPIQLRGRPTRRQAVKVQAIGFSFDDDDSRSRGSPAKRSAKVGSLGSLASSLLVFGAVVKGAVGEAYLAALAATQKYQASSKEILAAYGRFYSLLLTAGYDSWQDYVLDQILLGRDNAFARAAAQGSLDPGAPIHKAVAHDLDVLQELALPLPQIAELIADAVPAAADSYWQEAASSISTKDKKRGALPSASGSSVVTPLDPHTPRPYIWRPPSEGELADWRAAIAGREAWSEAVPLLRQYFTLHGFGITSRNSTLRWTKGAFEEGPEGSAAAALASLPPLPSLDPLRSTLDANTLAHAEGRPGASHALVAGPSGSGKSGLLWDCTLAAGRERGLRVVDVGPGELGALLEAARGCGRYPRLRFVLVADHVDFPLRGAQAAELCSGLAAAGAGPSGWPANALLYMGVSSTSTLLHDPVVNRFGLVLMTKDLSEEQFAATLRQLAGEDVARLTNEDVVYAVDWARTQRGGLSIRSAAQYVQRARGQ